MNPALLALPAHMNPAYLLCPLCSAQSIKRQYELEGVQLLLMVNEFRDHLVLNWHVSVWGLGGGGLALPFKHAGRQMEGGEERLKGGEPPTSPARCAR